MTAKDNRQEGIYQPVGQIFGIFAHHGQSKGIYQYGKRSGFYRLFLPLRSC